MAKPRDHDRAARIKRLRKEHHLSQRALAHELNVSERAVQEWERGGEVSFPNVVQLARIFSTTNGFILGIEDEPAGDGAPTEEQALEERVAALETGTAHARALLSRHDVAVREAVRVLSAGLAGLADQLTELQLAQRELGEQIALALLELRRDAAARARRAEDELAPGTRRATRSPGEGS